MCEDSLSADGPVLFGRDAAALAVAVGEVNPVAGEGHDAGVREDRARVRHEQQEDEEVEGDHVEAAPQAARHRLQHDPPAHTTHS